MLINVVNEIANRIWGIFIFLRFFLVVHWVKGFSILNLPSPSWI